MKDNASNYVVAGGGKLKVGDYYEVRHQRKGNFIMRITDLRGEWIEGVITEGVATALMSYNVKREGDSVTIRDCHSYFIPLNYQAS